jgi:hexulose-6-phosphate isomerase
VKGYREEFGWTGRYAFCGLGEGDVPWPATMAALRAAGYDTTLVAEMLPYSEGLLERTSAAMDRLLELPVAE